MNQRRCDRLPTRNARSSLTRRATNPPQLHSRSLTQFAAICLLGLLSASIAGCGDNPAPVPQGNQGAVNEQAPIQNNIPVVQNVAPNIPQQKQALESAVDQAFQKCIANWAKPQGDSHYYARGGEKLFRFNAGGATPGYKLEIDATPLELKDLETGAPIHLTIYSMTLTPNCRFSSKPTVWRDEKTVGDFPAIRPWSDELPMKPFTLQTTLDPNGVIYAQAFDGNWYPQQKAFDSNDALNGFRFALRTNAGSPTHLVDELVALSVPQMTKLLDRDESPLLSDEGRIHYHALLEFFKKVVHRQDGSYLAIPSVSFTEYNGVPNQANRTIRDSTTDVAEAIQRVLAKDRKEFDRPWYYPYFKVIEIRGGSHQIWLEELPISDLEKINGVTYRASADVVVSGFSRTREMKGSGIADNKVPPELEASEPWSDWTDRRGHLANFTIETKHGETTWKNETGGFQNFGVGPLNSDSRIVRLDQSTYPAGSLDWFASKAELSNQQLSLPKPAP